jgi:hypothetical protein
VGELVVAKNATVIWRIDQPHVRQDLHERILADGFQPKSEHHITLIGTLAAAQVPDLNALRAAVTRREPALRVADLYIDDDLYLVDHPKEAEGVVHRRETLIALARSAWIGVFMDGVSNEIATDIPRPFPHVTMYTRGSSLARRGIGIENPQQFVDYGRHVYTTGWQDSSATAA